MDKSPFLKTVDNVMASATKVSYADPLKCYQKTIRVLMSIGKESTHLEDKEVEILAAMCIVVSRDGDLSKSKFVIDTMVELGLPRLQLGTYRNYKSSIRKAGWLIVVEGQLHLNRLLSKAVKENGVAVGLFLNENKE